MRQVIRCLSLHQPLASFVGEFKANETRSWTTTYRGLVAIHAAKRNEPADAKNDSIWHRRAYARLGKRYEELPRGAIVSIGLLVGVIQMGSIEWAFPVPELAVNLTDQERAFGVYRTGRFAWRITDVLRLVTPIPLKGQQGLWTLDEGTCDLIAAAEKVPLNLVQLGG